MTGEPLSLWVEILVSAFLLLGSAFVLIGAIGLYRLPDFFMRLHGPTKATTLGVGGVIVASLIYFSNRQAGISLHELLISLFLFISAPVSAYMLARPRCCSSCRWRRRLAASPGSSEARRNSFARCLCLSARLVGCLYWESFSGAATAPVVEIP